MEDDVSGITGHRGLWAPGLASEGPLGAIASVMLTSVSHGKDLAHPRGVAHRQHADWAAFARGYGLHLLGAVQLWAALAEVVEPRRQVLEAVVSMATVGWVDPGVAWTDGDGIVHYEAISAVIRAIGAAFSGIVCSHGTVTLQLLAHNLPTHAGAGPAIVIVEEAFSVAIAHAPAHARSGAVKVVVAEAEEAADGVDTGGVTPSTVVDPQGTLVDIIAIRAFQLISFVTTTEVSTNGVDTALPAAIARVEAFRQTLVQIRLTIFTSESSRAGTGFWATTHTTILTGSRTNSFTDSVRSKSIALYAVTVESTYSVDTGPSLSAVVCVV